MKRTLVCNVHRGHKGIIADSRSGSLFIDTFCRRNSARLLRVIERREGGCGRNHPTVRGDLVVFGLKCMKSCTGSFLFMLNNVQYRRWSHVLKLCCVQSFSKNCQGTPDLTKLARKFSQPVVMLTDRLSMQYEIFVNEIFVINHTTAQTTKCRMGFTFTNQRPLNGGRPLTMCHNFIPRFLQEGGALCLH